MQASIQKVMTDLNQIKANNRKYAKNLTNPDQGVHWITPEGFRPLRKGEIIVVGDTFAKGVPLGLKPEYTQVTAKHFLVGLKSRGFGRVKKDIQVYRKLDTVEPKVVAKAVAKKAAVPNVAVKAKTPAPVALLKLLFKLSNGKLPVQIGESTFEINVSNKIAAGTLEAIAKQFNLD